MKPTKTTFTAYCDPGHGWVAVKRSFVEALGIADKITSFSDARGATVYLEEDQDVSTFVKAYEEKYGMTPYFTSKHTNNSSPIRSYDCYRA